jgi:YHS domain-containing protein
MNDLSSLDQRLASILADAARRRAQERAEREAAMRELEPRRIHFERIASAWVSELVVPRLHTLALALQQAGDVQHTNGGCSACLKLGRSEKYPVMASLTVSITADSRYERASVQVRPTLSPMLVGHPTASRSEFDLNADAVHSLVQFLDDQLMAFAKSYLRVHEPDSPYQHGSLVTDPVCGMTFIRTDGAESHEHEGRPFFFCASSCAERFRRFPDFYLRSRQDAPGGVT